MKFAIGAILVGMVAVIGLITIAQCDATSADDVRALIERDLPVGTDADEVIAFLKDHNAEIVERRLSEERDLFNYDIELGTPIVEGQFDKGEVSFNCDWKVVVIFSFDSSWKLDTYFVEEVGRTCL